MPDSLAVQAMRDYREALLDRDRLRLAQQGQAWLGVEQALGAETEVMALKMAADGPKTLRTLRLDRRWRSLQAQTRNELDKYVDYMDGSVSAAQKQEIYRGIEDSANALRLISAEAPRAVKFNKLDAKAVEYMVGNTGSGTPLRTVLEGAAKGGPDALAQELVNGIALGRDPIKTAKIAMRKGLGKSFTQMQTIARTETMRVYRQVAMDNMRANKDVVAYKRVAAHDASTCPACLFSDGEILAMSWDFEAHPNCRCTVVAVLDPKIAPAPVMETGQEWFVKQPEALQRELLGPARFDAWKAGDLKLGEMVERSFDETWGWSLQVPPLKGATGEPFIPALPQLGRPPAVPTIFSPQEAGVSTVFNWEPSMPRAKAEQWVRGSALPDDFYHVTTNAKAARSIEQGGFDLGHEGFGRQWGEGVYVGPDQAAVDLYKGWTGPSAETLTLKVNSINPAIYDASTGPKDFDIYDVLARIMDSTTDEADRLLNPVGKRYRTLDQVLGENGYDALVLRNVPGASEAGGNQIIVFDPKKVTVINE